MADLKHIFLCARINFIKWRRNPVVFGLMLCWVLYIWDSCRGLTEFCMATHSKITPWVLPFFMQGGVTMLMYLSLLTIFFAHAPFCNQHAPFTMIRTGKLSWFFGQLVYIVGAALAAVLLTYGAVLLVLLPTLGFSTQWGGVLQSLAEGTITMREYNIQCDLSISLQLMAQYGAVEATVLQLLMQWCASTLLGCTVLFFNVLIRPGAGVVAGFLMMSISQFSQLGALYVHRPFVKSLGILYWGNLMDLEPLRQGAPSMGTAALIHLLLIVVMIGLSTVIFSRRDTLFETDAF